MNVYRFIGLKTTIVKFGMLIVSIAFLFTTNADYTSEPLLVGTRETPPFAMQDKNGNWSGITIELWERIAAQLNIPYRYKSFTLPAILQGLEDGTVDVGAAALSITSERETVMDFSHPFFTTGLGIAVHQKQQPTLWSILRRVFSRQFLEIIATLSLVLFVFGFLIWFFERKRNRSQFGGNTLRGIGAGFWWSAVTMTTVGYGDKAPVTLWGRLVALIWMFAAIIGISIITASITSALTVASLDTEISGPQDLKRVSVGTINNTTSFDYLHDRGIYPKLYDSVEDALLALSSGIVGAIVYDAPILTYFINQNYAGKLHTLSSTFNPQKYGIALPLDSHLRQHVNIILLELIENGDLNRIKQRYLGE
ncbi:transporter substrate-binding domain-containing protein [Chitinispirillales bacterium ANBcel5]|uniref:transporter substrate-binding domain-containing protein n=1 Tax=Cellulosispirillum alkaliphilum TaxID=3039283 RepID=UPI002A54870C|nr:transporter substrate-binding domain-containing protein [Chitinispirillales bacterium ANBcel5]